MIEAFGLQSKRDVRAPKLSGGQRRRLLLARALMHEPRLVILDEPTAGVDFELRLELWSYIRRLHGEGATIDGAGDMPDQVVPMALQPAEHDESGVTFKVNENLSLHAEAIDYTCLHPWWQNDDILANGVFIKVPEKPSVFQETGIMRLEGLDGFHWRTPEHAASVLDRKFDLLEQRDFTSMRVLEVGGGQSTWWWAERAAEVVRRGQIEDSEYRAHSRALLWAKKRPALRSAGLGER